MQTTTAEQIRATVREAYGAVATQKQQGGCCGGGGSSSCCGPTGSSSTRLGYIDADLAAVPDGADLGLGRAVDACTRPGGSPYHCRPGHHEADDAELGVKQ
jgi:hypothetical protein